MDPIVEGDPGEGAEDHGGNHIGGEGPTGTELTPGPSGFQLSAIESLPGRSESIDDLAKFFQ